MNRHQRATGSTVATVATQRRILPVVLRTVLAVLAGFGFSTAVSGLGAVGLPLAFGMARSEAALLCSMLGFILYLAVLLWAFAEPRLMRVALVLVGGGAAAWWLARALAPVASAAGG